MSTLIGSAGSLAQLNKLINKYFFSEITLKPVQDGWLLFNSKGRIKNCWVKKIRNRYRFEMTDMDGAL